MRSVCALRLSQLRIIREKEIDLAPRVEYKDGGKAACVSPGTPALGGKKGSCPLCPLPRGSGGKKCHLYRTLFLQAHVHFHLSYIMMGHFRCCRQFGSVNFL